MAYRYSGYTAYINGVAFTQVGMARVTPNPTTVKVKVPGLLDTQAVLESYSDPTIQFQTGAVATMLALNSGAFAYAGLKCTSAASGFYIQRRESGSTFSSGSNHAKAECLAGFCYPTSLSCERNSGEGAMIDATFVPWSAADSGEVSGFTAAGLARPVRYTNAVALYGTAPAFVANFFLGPVYLGSDLLGCPTSFTLNFGIGYRSFHCAGPFPIDGAIYEREPSIDLAFDTADTLDLLTRDSLFTSAIGGSGLTVYLWKGAHGDSRVNPGTGAHVSLNFATGAVNPSEFGFQRTGDATCRITFTSTSTIAVSTTATIP